MVIGRIRLNGDVVIADPCYDMDTWCIGVVGNLVPGIYEVIITKDTNFFGYESVSSLVVNLVDPDDKSYVLGKDGYREVILDSLIGVDSGTCGIYDRDYFERIVSDNKIHDEWYDKFVINGNGVEITDNKGVISPTFIGDGSYKAYLLESNSGMIEGVCIDFIGDNDENEDEYSDDYDDEM